jgi:hypothetical protein
LAGFGTALCPAAGALACVAGGDSWGGAGAATAGEAGGESASGAAGEGAGATDGGKVFDHSEPRRMTVPSTFTPQCPQKREPSGLRWPHSPHSIVGAAAGAATMSSELPQTPQYLASSALPEPHFEQTLGMKGDLRGTCAVRPVALAIAPIALVAVVAVVAVRQPL